ncbi:MAG: LptF/LptG family permease [Luteitalea sp.]|nr:LptF/LptG family permease [Luteitalea sp.]
MLRILDRYLIREAITPTLLALLIFTFVLEIPIIMRDLEPLLTAGVSWALAGRILLLLLPQALAITIPMALMVGLLVALGRFSADRESVALQACGVSLLRLLRPIGLLAVVSTLASGYVMLEALPNANRSYREVMYRIVANEAQTRIRPRVFFEGFPDMVLYARDVQPGGVGWRELFIADSRNAKEPQIITATSGRLVLDRQAQRVDLALERGVVHRFGSSGDYFVDSFQTRTVSLDPETIFRNTSVSKDENSMTIAELREVAGQVAKAGLSPHSPVMAIHRKFSIPVACLVFGILALGLGVTDRKDAKQNSFVIGLGIFFAWYTFMYLGQSLAKGGQIPPEPAMWIPNIVLGGAGIVLLVFRVRGKELGDELRLPLTGAIQRLFARAPSFGLTPAASRPVARTRRGNHQPAVLVIRVPRQLFTRTGILDRYIASRYLRVFGLTMAAMLGLFYIGEFTQLSEKLFKGQATGAMLLRYFVLSTPQYTYYATALSSLVGAIAAVGLLTRTSELTAMRACGVSLYRASVPLLLFGALWSGLLFSLEETILPSTNREAKKLYDEIRGRAPRTTNVLQRQWLASAGSRLYHYAYYDPPARRFGDLTIYDLGETPSTISRRTYTAYAQYGTGPERQGVWHAGAGWIREFESGSVSRYEAFNNRTLPIESPDYFTQEEVNADVAERLGYRDLARYITDLRTAGFNVASLAVQLHRKLAFPFVTVIMTLIAIPFAVTTGRRGALYGIGAGIVLAIAYQTIQSAAAAVGSAGMLPPLLAAWAPNLLFASSAGYLLFTVRT